VRLSYRRTILAFLCIALGLAVGMLIRDREANAQQAADGGAPRFQISAFGAASQQGVFHGAYVVDTTTGQVWHVRAGGQPAKVADQLPPQ
jgi:hypothetical protein